MRDTSALDANPGRLLSALHPAADEGGRAEDALEEPDPEPGGMMVTLSPFELKLRGRYGCGDPFVDSAAAEDGWSDMEEVEADMMLEVGGVGLTDGAPSIHRCDMDKSGLPSASRLPMLPRLPVRTCFGAALSCRRFDGPMIDASGSLVPE
jgi:hypothetical protein